MNTNTNPTCISVNGVKLSISPVQRFLNFQLDSVIGNKQWCWILLMSIIEENGKEDAPPKARNLRNELFHQIYDEDPNPKNKSKEWVNENFDVLKEVLFKSFSSSSVEKSSLDSRNIPEECALLIFSWLIYHLRSFLYSELFFPLFFYKDKSENDCHTAEFDAFLKENKLSDWKENLKQNEMMMEMMKTSRLFKQYWYLFVYGDFFVKPHEVENAKNYANLLRDYVNGKRSSEDFDKNVDDVFVLSEIDHPEGLYPKIHFIERDKQLTRSEWKKKYGNEENFEGTFKSWKKLSVEWDNFIHKFTDRSNRRIDVVSDLKKAFPKLQVTVSPDYVIGKVLYTVGQLTRVKNTSVYEHRIQLMKSIIVSSPFILHLPKMIFQRIGSTPHLDPLFGELYNDVMNTLHKIYLKEDFLIDGAGSLNLENLSIENQTTTHWWELPTLKCEKTEEIKVYKSHPFSKPQTKYQQSYTQDYKKKEYIPPPRFQSYDSKEKYYQSYHSESSSSQPHSTGEKPLSRADFKKSGIDKGIYFKPAVIRNTEYSSSEKTRSDCDNWRNPPPKSDDKKGKK